MGDPPKNVYSALVKSVADKNMSMSSSSVMRPPSDNVSDQKLSSDASLPTSKLDFEQDKQNDVGPGPAKKRKLGESDKRQQYTRHPKDTQDQFIQELLQTNPRSVAAFARKKGINERTAQQWMQKERRDKDLPYRAKRGRLPKSTVKSAFCDAATVDESALVGDTLGKNSAAAGGTSFEGASICDSPGENSAAVDDPPIKDASVGDKPAKDAAVDLSLLSNFSNALSYDHFVSSVNDTAFNFNSLFRYSNDTLFDDMPRHRTVAGTPMSLNDNDNASTDTFDTPVDNPFDNFVRYFHMGDNSFESMPTENAPLDFPLFPSDVNRFQFD